MENTPPQKRPAPPAALALFDHEINDLSHASASAEARSRQLLAAMTAFRDGDFSVRLPSDWVDLDGRLAEAFNQALGYEERLAREAARLSETVGRDGRLRQRMS